jgi:hypothetical protein
MKTGELGICWYYLLETHIFIFDQDHENPVIR